MNKTTIIIVIVAIVFILATSSVIKIIPGRDSPYHNQPWPTDLYPSPSTPYTPTPTGTVNSIPGKVKTTAPGWELYTEIVGIQYGDVKNYADVIDWQIDVDEGGWGLPDIKVRISDVREQMPKLPYATTEYKVKNFTYTLNYHEYIFDVQIRTVANLKDVGDYCFEHETRMPFNWHSKTLSGTNKDAQGDAKIGVNFVGGTFVRFSCSPWVGFDQGQAPGSQYVFNTYWLGVMNAKVEKTSVSKCVEDLPENWAGWVRGIEPVGGQLTMFEDSGVFGETYGSIPWDTTKVLSDRINSKVVMYLPFDIMAGAYEKWSGDMDLGRGAIAEAKPIDYALTYTVRIEAVVVKEWEARNPAISPNPSPVEPPKDYVPHTELSWLEENWFTVAIIIVVFITVLIILAITTPLLSIGMLSGMYRRSRSRLYIPEGGDRI